MCLFPTFWDNSSKIDDLVQYCDVYKSVIAAKMTLIVVTGILPFNGSMVKTGTHGCIDGLFMMAVYYCYFLIYCHCILNIDSIN
jgi:hypothetical protein